MSFRFYREILSLSTLLGTLYYYWVGPSFDLKTASILCAMESTRCWKQFFEILFHVDTIASQYLPISQLHIHAANLLFNHVPKVFYWIHIQWLGRPLKNIKLIVMFMRPVWEDFSFVTWCIIMLEVAIRRCVHCGHEWMVSNNTQIACGIQEMIDCY